MICQDSGHVLMRSKEFSRLEDLLDGDLIDVRVKVADFNGDGLVELGQLKTQDRQSGKA